MYIYIYVPGAMSTLLPLCDAFLGIQMTSAELGALVEKFTAYMPENHRRFVEVFGNLAVSFLAIQFYINGGALSILYQKIIKIYKKYVKNT